MKYKNMKIAITDNINLKEVCEVLESMGYECGNAYFFKIESLKAGLIKSIASYENGSYYFYNNLELDCIYNCQEILLSSLIKMRDEMK